jgi:cytochrome c biogenesis protein CcmG/thiol:disulfide interchange protein DsbE
MQPNKYTWLWSILIGFSLTVVASAEIKVGENFPDLAGCKLEGALPTLPKDSVILVDFWASWCGPCLRSFPAMEELSKAYASKGLIIVAVNVDEKKGDMEIF